jgi:hypothetical protein
VSRGFDHFMVFVNVGRGRKLKRNFKVAERWCFVAGVLPIAAKAPVRGRLLMEGEPADAKDVADEAGVPLAVATSTLAKMRKLEMLVPDEELACERVHDWEQHNPEPKKDKTAAERAKRYRERLRRQRHGTVTDASRRDVTAVTPPVTPTEEKRSSFANAQEPKGKGALAPVDVELIERVQQVVSEVGGQFLDEVNVANAISRFPGIDHWKEAQGCAEYLSAHPDKPAGHTLHRYFEKAKPSEPTSGRNKGQREADGIAAIRRVVERGES